MGSTLYNIYLSSFNCKALKLLSHELSFITWDENANKLIHPPLPIKSNVEELGMCPGAGVCLV